MRPAVRLLHHASRITLFTRANCSLCDNAKSVLSKVWDKHPFEYSEIDVMAPREERWKVLYEYDTPVIHVEKDTRDQSALGVVAQSQRLMHRFTEAEVRAILADVEERPEG